MGEVCAGRSALGARQPALGSRYGRGHTLYETHDCAAAEHKMALEDAKELFGLFECVFAPFVPFLLAVLLTPLCALQPQEHGIC